MLDMTQTHTTDSKTSVKDVGASGKGRKRRGDKEEVEAEGGQGKSKRQQKKAGGGGKGGEELPGWCGSRGPWGCSDRVLTHAADVLQVRSWGAVPSGASGRHSRGAERNMWGRRRRAKS
jgi:hypothetical protein